MVLPPNAVAAGLMGKEIAIEGALSPTGDHAMVEPPHSIMCHPGRIERRSPFYPSKMV